MRNPCLAALTALAALLPATGTSAQVAGSTDIAVLRTVVIGMSAKKQILGQKVYNEDGVKVGKIDDLVIAPDNAVSYVIVGAGGFVGMRRHQVAFPTNQLKSREDGFTLPGATKAAVRDLPPFDYAKPLPEASTYRPSFTR